MDRPCRFRCRNENNRLGGANASLFSKASYQRGSSVALLPRHLVSLRGTSRSEEHTSELQSLMRNSYAVFCLKKKKNTLAHTGRCRIDWTRAPHIYVSPPSH